MLNTIDYRNASDTGEPEAAAIQPITDGEPANQGVFRRPPENLRSRSDILRQYVREQMALQDYRQLIQGGGGTITFAGAYNTYAGTFSITADLWMLPFATPGNAALPMAVGSTKAALLVGSGDVLKFESKYSQWTKPATDPVIAAEANKISVEIVHTGALSVAVNGASGELNNIYITINFGTTTCQQVIDAVNAHTDANKLVVATLASGTAANPSPKFSTVEWGTDWTVRFLRGGAPGLVHTITNTVFSDFFADSTDNLLRIGDTLAIWYDSIVNLATAGGRLQSTNENSNTAILKGSLFNTRREPHKIPNCIPVCKCTDVNTLMFFSGALIARGTPGTLIWDSTHIAHAGSGGITINPTTWVRIAQAPCTHVPLTTSSTVQEALDNIDSLFQAVLTGAQDFIAAAGNHGLSATGSDGHPGLMGYGLTNGNGVEGHGGATTGRGVHGTGGGGNGIGVEGVGGATNGIGVYGLGSGSGPGVYGVGGDDDGHGISGDGRGVGHGGHFNGGGDGGNGVYGAAGGDGAVGVYGVTTYASGAGVAGQGSGGFPGVIGYSPAGSGVFGEAAGGGGYGVEGHSETNSGVYGHGGGTTGAGVYGVGNSASPAPGVKGQGGGTKPGVAGYGGSGDGGTAYGVYGEGGGNSKGVYGKSNTVGVEGHGNSNAAGVVGSSDSGNGTGLGVGAGYGVHGVSGSSHGVYGESVSGNGVYGGTAGTRANYRAGVYGYATNTAAGVKGENTYRGDFNAVGVHGIGGGGHGIRGECSANTSAVAGVYGYSIDGSPAVYGEGTSTGLGVQGSSFGLDSDETVSVPMPMSHGNMPVGGAWGFTAVPNGPSGWGIVGVTAAAHTLVFELMLPNGFHIEGIKVLWAESREEQSGMYLTAGVNRVSLDDTLAHFTVLIPQRNHPTVYSLEHPNDGTLVCWSSSSAMTTPAFVPYTCVVSNHFTDILQVVIHGPYSGGGAELALVSAIMVVGSNPAPNCLHTGRAAT